MHEVRGLNRIREGRGKQQKGQLLLWGVSDDRRLTPVAVQDKGGVRVAKARDYDFIPQSYGELYAHYFKPDSKGSCIVRTLIRRQMRHATEVELEELSNEIFLRMQATNQLEVFDPKKANFGGAVFYVTRSICCNYMDRKGRDPMTGLNGGTLVEADEEADAERWQPGTYDLSKMQTEQVGTERRFMAKEIVSRLKAWTDALAKNPRHVRDEQLGQLLDLLYEGHDVNECAKRLGRSVTTVTNWVGIIAEQAKRWM